MAVKRSLSLSETVSKDLDKLMKILFYVAESADAYDRVWFIGDVFFSNTYTKYFKNAFGDEGQLGYIRAHYDVTGFCLGTDKLNTSILSRLRNAFVKAVNTQVTFPKAIVIILEQDFLNEIDHFKPGISLILGKVMEHLANKFHRLVTSHKERLPSKARKFKYPTILWALLPEHYDWKESNESRAKLNKCIINTTSLFREMSTLTLEWDDCDRSYFTRDNLNAKGLSTYWDSINRAFEIWDKSQMKAARVNSCVGKKKKINTFREDVTDAKKFHWKPESTRFKLPDYRNKSFASVKK